MRWTAKREWPAHSLGIGLVSSFNFRPLHKPSPIMRFRRGRNREREREREGEKEREEGKTIRANLKDHLRDRIPPLGQKQLT